VQEALNRTGGQVQYHALGLMYLIKQHDKMAVIKIIQTLSRGNSLRSPYAYCMLIRYTFKIMDDDGGMDGYVCTLTLPPMADQAFEFNTFFAGQTGECLKCWKIAFVIAMKWLTWKRHEPFAI
jgi:hypothetical protein